MPAKEKRPLKQPIIEGDTFYCGLCADKHGEGGEFDRAAFVVHVKEAHPEALNADGELFAVREPVMHLDGSDFYMWQYRWKLPDGRQLAAHVEVRKRRGKDKRAWR